MTGHKYPNVAGAFKYAEDILSGKIIANKFIKGACRRFQEDIEYAKNDDCPYRFEPEKAERYLRLVQKFKHVKGRWKNPYIQYEDWQKFIFANLFGFINKKTGYRRFRTAYIEIARGNAKSTMCSQLGLFGLALDNPIGNEIYSAATKKEQARIVLDSARAMARKNSGFLDATGTKVRAHEIIHEDSDSFFRALSSDSKSLDGLLPAFAIIDELHAHKDRHVYDVIDSGMSKRVDSMLVIITTAGFDESGIGYSQSNYGKKICTGELEDETYFSVVYTVDDENEANDQTTWIKANPNWGVSVDPINFTAKHKKSLQDPKEFNNFKVKHLNIWTSGADPFFHKQKLRMCADHDLKLENFFGQKCYMSVDLASKKDIASVGYMFKHEGKYVQFTENFLPKETLKTSRNNSYAKWEQDGLIIATPGASLNYPKLQDHIRMRCTQVDCSEMFYDPWNAAEFAQRMKNDHIAEMVEFGQNCRNFSEPMKRLDALILENEFRYSGDEVLAWALGNVTARIDNNENVFPRKNSMEEKIDPAIVTIMCLAGWILEEENQSVYEERGIIFF